MRQLLDIIVAQAELGEVGQVAEPIVDLLDLVALHRARHASKSSFTLTFMERISRFSSRLKSA
eukprot:768190-Hanusia_phi.AAC.1